MKRIKRTEQLKNTNCLVRHQGMIPIPLSDNAMDILGRVVGDDSKGLKMISI